MKRRLKKPVKIAIFVILAFVLLGAGYGCWRILHDRSIASLSLSADEAALTVEAGTQQPDYSSIFHSQSEYTVDGNVDIMKTGTYPVTVTVHGKNLIGQPKDAEYSYTFTVQDTTAPDLKIDESRAFVLAGEPFDPLSHFISAEDLLDGSITLDSGRIVRKDSEDLTKLGEHTIVLSAADSSGNEVEKSYVLAVGKKEEGKNPYVIRINRAENTVNVYMMNENGEYALPAAAMVCSTGTATPAGTFHIGNKTEWRSLFGGVFGQYAIDITGDILFHSVPYFTQEKNNLEYEEYNKLGTAASLGCIRLCVRDVKWIYDTCPSGTLVEIYDEAGVPGPLGKPEPVHIDTSDSRKGWDPTDPDPENPWNTKS